MTGLVILAGVLAVASGLLKLLGRSRSQGQVSLMGLLEILTGVFTPTLIFTNDFDPDRVGVILAAMLLLVLVTSTVQWMISGSERQKRLDTEGARLVTYVKYLSHGDGERPVPPSFNDLEPPSA